MKYLKFILKKFKNIIYAFFKNFVSVFFVLMLIIWSVLEDGYLFGEIDLESINLNPNDYCNLTDVDYTAIVHDDPYGQGYVEITEYLTYDVHAASIDNTFKEVWIELPETETDGLINTYNVKSVTQILADGTEIKYEETPKMYWEDEDYTQYGVRYWHHSKGSGRYPDNDESLIMYIPWTYRDQIKFKIIYTMNNASLRYADCSELYLSIYSGNTIKKLKSLKAQILVPNKLMPSQYLSFSFGTRKSRIPYIESNDMNPGYHTFAIDLKESDLKFDFHNRYVEFCLLSYGKDKHIFTKFTPNNDYSNDNVLQECIDENNYYESKTEIFRICKLVLLVLSIMLSIYVIYSAKKKYEKVKSKYLFFEPNVNYTEYREIPSDLDPIFASELVFMKDPCSNNKEKQEEYAAILLSLVRKQYIKISKVNSNHDWSNFNTQISLEQTSTTSSILSNIESPIYSPEPVYSTINTNSGKILEPLSVSERLYLELLERHIKGTNNSITIEKFQNCINADYEHTNSFIKDMEKKPSSECGILQGYYQNAKYDAPKKEVEKSASICYVLALILLIAFNGISYFTPLVFCYGAYTILGLALLYKYIYLSVNANNLILLTPYGTNEQAKWYGLYKFLNSDTLINEREIHELPLWEKYLIYATAFGISEKVIKAIKIHAVEINVDDSLILNNHCYIHSTHFHSTSRAFGNSLHTSGRGGVIFSGHGYGGGGRGGGGGGGGH